MANTYYKEQWAKGPSPHGEGGLKYVSDVQGIANTRVPLHTERVD